MGIEAYLDEQLTPEALDASEVESRLARFTTLSMTPGELFEKLASEEIRPPQIVGELIAATLTRHVYSPRQLFEVMVDFWSDHFNIYVAANPAPVLKPTDDRDVIRAHALGKFRDLLWASAHSPAMLTYLDNARSTKEGPNENYAREIMELHTLGVNGGYTHMDVVEVARAFTGWSITNPRDARRSGAEPGRFLFRENFHDDGAKSILGVTFPAGQGIRDGEQVIDLLAAHPSTATHVVRKLCARFISDTPPDSIVSQAAQTFTDTDGDIRAVLRTILTSEEFAASIGQKVKRPLDFFANALRVTNAEIEFEVRPRDPRTLFDHLAALGQVPFFWQTPDGYPDQVEAWLSNGALLARWNFALALVGGQVPLVRPNLDGLLDGVDSVEDAVDRIATTVLGETLPSDARSIVSGYAKAAPDDMKGPGAIALMLGSPHFQVR